MKRRQFLETGVVSAGALLLRTRPKAQTPQENLPPRVAALQSLRFEEPPPISESERAERRAKAQRLMAEEGIDALLVEPGPTLTYFSGIGWGRSERLFGMLLPKRGNAVFVSPAFERERADGAEMLTPQATSLDPKDV